MIAVEMVACDMWWNVISLCSEAANKAHTIFIKLHFPSQIWVLHFCEYFYLCLLFSTSACYDFFINNVPI